MHLQKLHLLNFKNIKEANLSFQGNIQVLVGKNGSGKTNLLDAIYYLSFTRSAFNSADQQNILFDESYFSVRGEFEKEGKQKKVVCVYQQNQKKSFREDELEYTKFSDHIGRYPVVLIAPQDVDLITGSSEARRKFFDTLISQLDKPYLQQLIVYQQVLKERNSLLKMSAERGLDTDLLESYDEKLIPAAHYIYKKRNEFIVQFLPDFLAHYHFLADEPGEDVSIFYESELAGDDFRALLIKNRQRDLMMQRTSSGIHRDDFVFRLNQRELKRIGSQGQQKSFLVALKFAEFQSIERNKQNKPILLLDDIFDKLDDKRIQKLLEYTHRGIFGQIFITDARTRTEHLLKDSGIIAEVFQVSNGEVTHG
ncbi:MAG: DNA replication and repair protein RecF [Flammeovirgaceae bacterium]|nr:DNA replication and repair protein RecF [Flammeovirgaceae bacterium]